MGSCGLCGCALQISQCLLLVTQLTWFFQVSSHSVDRLESECEKHHESNVR